MIHQLENRIKVVYEDEDILALNKPNGLLVEGIVSGERTLTDWAIAHSNPRARALHRIDRDTSGLVLFAKNSKWNRELTDLFERKRIRKEYWAIVKGAWDPRRNKVETKIRRTAEGKWENHREQGKEAKTTFRVLGQDQTCTWIQALPKTGRTHQIRLHCLEAGCPIVGDRFYSDDRANPLLLHARGLRFLHPAGTGEVQLNAVAPSYWANWLSIFPNSD